MAAQAPLPPPFFLLFWGAGDAHWAARARIVYTAAVAAAASKPSPSLPAARCYCASSPRKSVRSEEADPMIGSSGWNTAALTEPACPGSL